VTQADDGDLGDLTKATVVFDVTTAVSGGPVAATTVPATVAADGTATATLSLFVGNYTVAARLIDDAPNYFSGPGSEMGVLTVYAPTSGIWATGGGWIRDPGTNNLPVAIDPDNDHGSFGFSVRYKSGTTTPQGQSVYVFHGANGYDYVVKSNTWRGGAAAFTRTTARFSGKASVQVYDPASGTYVSGLGGGNFTYRVDVTDGGQGGSADRYAISVYDSRGKLYHRAGDFVNQLPLQGGNITVHAK
jgi:hypothetical protein